MYNVHSNYYNPLYSPSIFTLFLIPKSLLLILVALLFCLRDTEFTQDHVWLSMGKG